jgi:hypothetical protein
MIHPSLSLSTDNWLASRTDNSTRPVCQHATLLTASSHSAADSMRLVCPFSLDCVRRVHGHVVLTHLRRGRGLRWRDTLRAAPRPALLQQLQIPRAARAQRLSVHRLHNTCTNELEHRYNTDGADWQSWRVCIGGGSPAHPRGNNRKRLEYSTPRILMTFLPGQPFCSKTRLACGYVYGTKDLDAP